MPAMINLNIFCQIVNKILILTKDPYIFKQLLSVIIESLDKMYQKSRGRLPWR